MAQDEKRGPVQIELGATGEYPQGQLDENDEGELRMAIAGDPSIRKVRVVFGKPVAWLGLDPDQADSLAKQLVKHAEIARGAREGRPGN